MGYAPIVGTPAIVWNQRSSTSEMASVGHVAVGMAAARIYHSREPLNGTWKASMAFWSLLSLFPDADVIGFPLRVPYGAEWGHRGATHSLVFNLGVGIAIGLVATVFRRPFLRTAALACAVLVSHPLLDMLT